MVIHNFQTIIATTVTKFDCYTKSRHIRWPVFRDFNMILPKFLSSVNCISLFLGMDDQRLVPIDYVLDTEDAHQSIALIATGWECIMALRTDEIIYITEDIMNGSLINSGAIIIDANLRYVGITVGVLLCFYFYRNTHPIRCFKGVIDKLLQAVDTPMRRGLSGYCL
ncbi:hypothetical protein C497_00100 [Halalkalicoccus jeotgali B3]|uniref:Uncharacterized protein n=1 Tax=Halalkalicoccus jeotgali (strain DSM 18796 / CECT 7217 / JCM 14584 / KCTC 4019 / B3) TaxID=795797 RepID=D8JD92_HALJB|nr:hypothetical protein HacjB3_19548 [Halalkalicoccus jeotgali B3]ELY41956.1 hypothetical protein C497_00100 [Halalkalicoccus jeotgali B3]